MAPPMTASNKHPKAPWRNFYGRIHGPTLNQAQKDYLDEDLEALSPGPVGWDVNPERRPLDLKARFGGVPVWLEIGFGGGEHLVHMAKTHPQMAIIGCEPYINGVAMLLGKIRRLGTQNVAVHPGDARDLFDVLPEASIDRLSRSLAQETPPPSPVRDARASGAAGARAQTGRDVSRRDRYSRLRAPDAGAGAAPRVRVAG